MLIVTDRQADIGQTTDALSKVHPCTVASPADAGIDPQHLLVVCDVDFRAAGAIDGLKTLLDSARARDVPLLCLLRDPSRATFELARELGATAVLSAETSPVELAARVRRLLLAGPPVPTTATSGELARNLATASRALQELFAAARGARPLSTEVLHAGALSALSGVRPTVDPWLDAARRLDDITYQHCLLVTGLTAAFAVSIGLSWGHQKLLAQAALVHDIGKVAIPTAILNKPSRLSEAEMTLMRTHPVRGHEMLDWQDRLDPRIADIVRHHHEYLDGSGYPDGLRGPDIAAHVRVVTICDIYAALIERRAYKRPMKPLQAFAILDEMGDKLDRGLLSIFREMIAPPAERRPRVA